MGIVVIYTDGACSGNPGPGGWAAVLKYGEHEKCVSGFEDATTNNRMEIMAALKGLEQLKKPCQVELYSDSAYLVDACNKGWLGAWQRNNWQTKNKTDVKNQDLWQQLLEHMQKHRITFIKVAGHSDDVYNNVCDEMAREAIRRGRKDGDDDYAT